MREKVSLEFPARDEYIQMVRLAISGICNGRGLSYDEIEDVKLAVAEACTNAIHHAYIGRDPSKETVKVECFLNADVLEIVVKDQGKGFQPDHVQKFNLSDLKPKEGHLGMGIHLMKTLMDRVEIHSDTDGTEVHLYQQLEPKDGEVHVSKE